MPADTIILIRGGTAAEWDAANPVLSFREMGLETDTKKIKVGDGSTAWNSLDYYVTNGVDGDDGTDGANADLTRFSPTSNTIGTGAKTFAYATSNNLGWVVGTRLRAANSATNFVEGVATAVSATSVTIDVDTTAGSGTYTSWAIAVAGERGPTGATGAAGSNGSNGSNGANGLNADMTRTSTSSVTIGTNDRVFAFSASSNLGWVLGTRLRATNMPSSAYIEGVVTVLSSTSVTIKSDKTGGSGTYSEWSIGVAGDPGTNGSGTNTSQTGVLANNATATVTHPTDSSDLRAVDFLVVNSADILLLNANGSNGSSTIVNGSSSGLVVSSVGAVLTTSNFKYGNAAIQFNGTSHYLTIPDNAFFDLAAADFCIEAWIRMDSLAGARMIFGKGGDGWENGGYGLYYFGGSLIFAGLSPGPAFFSATFSWSPSTNVWYHVALSRSGNNLRAFVDGTQIGSTVSFAVTIQRGGAVFEIGRRADGNYFSGQIDDFRMTTGVPVYTANFTAPTTELGNFNPVYRPATLTDSLAGSGVVAEYLTATTTRFTNKLGRSVSYKAIVRT
jgi:hypothetical protein